MSALLASVRDRSEARIALAGGVDLLDLKEPAAGALGALPIETVRDICTLVNGRVPVSATVGDLPPGDGRVHERVRALAGTPVDIVKLGLFPERRNATQAALDACLESLGSHQSMVLVLSPIGLTDGERLRAWARLGIAGVMVDTFDKQAGPLTSQIDLRGLARFVNRVQAAGLLCGLAGSLRTADIPTLLPMGPDFLGFRSALCATSRETALSRDRLRAVRAALPTTARVPLRSGEHPSADTKGTAA